MRGVRRMFRSWVLVLRVCLGLGFLFTAPWARAQITFQGLTDKSTYNGTVSFTVVTQAGFHYGAALNQNPIPVGTPVTVNRMDYYDLWAWRTNASAPSEVVSNLVRFIVVASDRGSPEKGLSKWTPYPRIPSTAAELAGAQLQVTVPLRYPPGLPIPVVVRVDNTSGQALRINAVLSAAGFEGNEIPILRGHGSGLLPAATNAGPLTYLARLHGLDASRSIDIDTNTSWTPMTGVLPLSVTWPENSRIHLTGHLTIPTNGIVTVGAGTVIKLDPLVNLTNSGRLVLNGTPDQPIVLTATNVVATERYPSIGWGSVLLRGSQAALEATHTIFVGGGGAPSFDFTPAASHKSAQATLLFHRGAQVNLSHCAVIFNAGQVVNAYASTITYDHCLFQRAITSGEYSGGCTVTISQSAIIEFPADDGIVDATIADGDYDAIYFTEGTYTLKDSLIGFAKDDAIDSGSGAAGTVIVTNCWIESALHEGLAWSCDGVGRVTRTLNTVTMNNGQGIECGWGRGVGSPDCFADGILSTANAVGARFGDNYTWQYLGFLRVTNSLLFQNRRDVFLKTWNAPGSGPDTNSWVDRLGQVDFRGNRFTTVDPRFPENRVWDPTVDGASLARWMTTPTNAPVGIGLALRTNRLGLAQTTDGVPVRLSSFTTHPVSVDYVVVGTNGVMAAATLEFLPGETLHHIPLPELGVTSAIRMVSLRNPVQGEITGLAQAWVIDETQAGGGAPTRLVAKGSTWRYRDTGGDPGPGWHAPTLDDRFWSNGLAQLGFSNGEELDEATPIRRLGTNGQNSVAFYFRQSFLVPDPSVFADLSLWMLRDDGGAVYLNGQEVFRSDSLPAAPFPLTFQTLATNYNNGAAPPDNSIDTDILDVSWLRTGTNVVAVEIHQQSAGSSDLSFDFQLEGNPARAETRILRPPESQAVPPGGTANFSVEASGDAPLGFQWWRDQTLLHQTIGPVLLLTNVSAADAGNYRVIVVGRETSVTSPPALLVVQDADNDGDGMPDAWERNHGLDPLVPDAEGDPDLDGSPNRVEYLAGTNPQDPASAFRIISFTFPEGPAAPWTLVFPGVAGHDYQVQCTDTLAPAALWVELARIVVQGSDRLVTWSDPGSTNQARRFYRIQTRAVP